MTRDGSRTRGASEPSPGRDGPANNTPHRPPGAPLISAPGIGHSRPTIGDVARLAGVSKSSVSFVVNDRPGVGTDARERILRAMAELGWQPSARARALSSSRAMALGFVVRRNAELLSTDPFFAQFLAGLEAGLAPRGYALVLQVVEDDESERRAYQNLATEGRVDGVLLSDLRTDDPRLALVTELGLPTLLVGHHPAPGTHAQLALDDTLGVSRAVQHLISLGHRSIGHVGGTRDYQHTRVRFDAWHSALTSAGLVPGPFAEGDYTAAAGARATHALLDLAEPPTAIVYGNDLMAIAGMNSASTRGLVVPDDLSVVGFDDVPLAPYISPALTTVRHDVLAWGRAAAAALVAVTEGKAPPTPGLPAPEFVIRASTAKAPPRPTPSGDGVASPPHQRAGTRAHSTDKP